MNMRQVFWLIGLLGGTIAAIACNNDLADACLNPKDPDGIYNDPLCKDGRAKLEKNDQCLDPTDSVYPYPLCQKIRAEREAASAKDGGADGDAGESDADSEPDGGSAHNCVPNHPNEFADPQPVWFGAKGDAPEECPEDIGAFGDRSYLALSEPGLEGCPLCACGPIGGVCTPQVTSIHFRGAVCDVAEASTIDFSPPENWDGSCSNNHSIAPNAECPALGSGNPCVQSSYASALPDPVEGCKPIEVPVPKLITDTPYWQEVALSCSPTRISPPSKENPSQTDLSLTCFNRPDGWRSCVRHEDPGIHDCKTGSDYFIRKIVYPENAFIDHRSCSACECKASGGTCYASFRLYEDDICTKLLTQSYVFSDKATCADVVPGMGVGSKEIVDPVYIPGSCEPTGGVPVGGVDTDATNAVTWCCLAKEPEPMYF